MNGITLQSIAALQAGTTANPSTDTGTPAANDLSFNQILSTMLLASSLSAIDNGNDINKILTPMMMLMEQLLSQQLPSETTSLNAGSNTLISNISNNTTPQGKPVEGVLTQSYHPGHNGLDFGVVVGTPIKSTMSGKVTYAGWNNQGYGNLVIVENGPYKTYYAHLSEIPVTVGQQVQAGSTIGLSGNTGNSTGPHLHYEIRYNDQPIDPTQQTLGYK